MIGARVFLDACVLFPTLVRRVVLGCADMDLFHPVWSQRVLDEWQIAIGRQQGPEAETEVIAVRRDMAERFAASMVPASPDLQARFDLPDPADTHVLAAASGRADILLTFNLRDFPSRKVAEEGLEVRHPDSFLWELHSHLPDPVDSQIRTALKSLDVATERGRASLKRARLPRLGKAWDAARQCD